MLPWLIQYLPTILICLALAAVFGLLLWSLIRDKKKGKSSCGCSCSGCAMAGQCHAASKQSSRGKAGEATQPSPNSQNPHT